MAAVQQNGKALEYASDDLKANRAIVMAAVQQNWVSLRSAANKLKYVQTRAPRRLELVSRQHYARSRDAALVEPSLRPACLRVDKEIVMAAVKIDGHALDHASKFLQADKEVVLAAVKQTWEALKFSSVKLQADREVVDAGVQQSGHALEYASKELRADRKLVLVAVRDDGLTLRHASVDLKADREVRDSWSQSPPTCGSLIPSLQPSSLP